MTNNNCTTESKERKRGQHLGREERGAIQTLNKLGYSNRAIGKAINCSPTTVGNELKRGTGNYCGKGRKPKYSAKRGQSIYKANRKNCRRRKTVKRNSEFLRWMVAQISEEKWSFDTCVGHARRHNSFPHERIPCTKTLYNLLWNGELAITLFDMPEVLGRRTRGKPRIPKRLNGKSIDLRPAEVSNRNTFGHWESDTVIGKKKKGEPVVFTIVERLTNFYLTIRIYGKNTDGVAEAMGQLHQEFGENFHHVFRSITTDNGSEFAAFATFEKLGTEIYYAHPYSSWERPVNERSNRILRRFIPKGKSISKYSEDQVLVFSDKINSTPRKILDYNTPEELFEEQLDRIYSL